MRSLLTALFLAATLPIAMGQNTTPANQNIIPGKALIKVKPEFKNVFQAGSSKSGRSALGASAIRSLAPGAGAKRKTGRAQALKPVVDISQYFEITFDPTQPVAQYIQSLYATGYIEIAEPEYRQQLLYTPNDPDIGNEWYLDRIGAINAWDITQGEGIVIAIVDSGGDLDHPDIGSQLYINTAENPTNGIDDDGNGFIDDYRGWDFSGADAANVVGDNDPSITTDILYGSHGTSVASCASSATDNGVGKAGVGFKAKLLFTKHFSDNTTSGNYNTDTYMGVLYAALSGAQIINCSWGSSNYSAIQQDIMTYVTQDLGCLVVAAAGNTPGTAKVYPASYDHVIAVAASDQQDKATWFTTYNHAVDITAPGDAIYIAIYDNKYTWDTGTSLSAPIVSGAAALVWAAHPEYTGDQVGEQLRVSANPALYQNNDARYTDQLGRGRLDVYAALTQQSPSVRASNLKFTNTHNAIALPGDTMLLYLDFKNYLKPTSSALQITITPESSFGTALQNSVTPGSIGTNGVYSNTATPFRIKTSSLGENVTTEIRIDYKDGNYQDYQYVTLMFNPTYVTVNKNNITTTITSAGRIGFGDVQSQQQGVGFLFNGTPLLYEMGLIMGTSETNLRNNVRAMNNTYAQDFVSVSPITTLTPGSRSEMEVYGAFADSADASKQTVNVSYRSLVWTQAPNDNFIILEYKIRNPRPTTLTNFYYGIFADWDISPGGGQDAAGWNAKTRTGYAYAKGNTTLPYAGIQLLTASPQYYAIDNNQTLPGNPFGLYDGFSNTEKFTSISTSGKMEAGMSVAAGTDISHVVATGPYTIAPNAEITVAFALLAADNLEALLASAAHADTLYNLALPAAKPVVPQVSGCVGKDVNVTATGANNYHWYGSAIGGQPVSAGATITIPNLQHDTTLYVSAVNPGYESLRTAVTITKAQNPTASFTMNATSLESGVPVQFTDNSIGANTWAWSFGDNNTSTQQNPQHTYNTGGSYTITLTVTAANKCQDATTQKLAIITGTEQGLNAGISIYPNPVSAGTQHVINLALGNTTGKTIKATLSTPQGQQLARTSFAATDNVRTIDITDYKPGLYILMLTTGNVTYTYKVLITP